jgi:hypothetical protein
MCLDPRILQHMAHHKGFVSRGVSNQRAVSRIHVGGSFLADPKNFRLSRISRDSLDKLRLQ